MISNLVILQLIILKCIGLKQKELIYFGKNKAKHNTFLSKNSKSYYNFPYRTWAYKLSKKQDHEKNIVYYLRSYLALQSHLG